MLRICIISHSAYGAMLSGVAGHIGGVELQTAMTARWLAGRGHQVSLITWDEGQKDDVINGVRIIKTCRKNSGLRGVRFLYPRWISLNRAMSKAASDIYYQNCGEYVTGQVALWCKMHGRRFVYSVASDPDCDPRLPEMKTLRERVLYRYGLHNAERIIVQTNKQKKMLYEGFNLNSAVLPMPSLEVGEHKDQQQASSNFDNFRVLWIGRIARVKRLELLFEIAKKLPEIQFDVAGSPDVEDCYSRKALSEMKTFKNIIYHGRVPRDQIPGLYKKASILCCTSLYEGFPNTFLEAWSRGIPTVTTVDPDDIITDYRLGIHAIDAEGLIAGIRMITEEKPIRDEMSANSQKYFIEKHSTDKALSRFEDLFWEVRKGKKAKINR